jgi:hypothetical protein
VGTAQVREQLQLGLVADHRVRAADLDAGLVELRQQPVDRNLEHLRELADRNFRHGGTSAQAC